MAHLESVWNLWVPKLVKLQCITGAPFYTTVCQT